MYLQEFAATSCLCMLLTPIAGSQAQAGEQPDAGVLCLMHWECCMLTVVDLFKNRTLFC